MEVRFEQDTDRTAVRAVHLAAFGDHGRVVASLVDDLRGTVADGAGLSLVAREGDEVVGHALVTPSLLDAPRRLVAVRVLSPVGVLPASQRQEPGRR